jgi:hypothetical protein
MTTPFNMTRDINGFNGFGLPFSDTKYSGILTTGAAQAITIPSAHARYLAIFAFDPGTSVWVSNGHTAVYPTGAVSTTNSSLNPTARMVMAGDVLSFITSDTSVEFGVVLYAVE